MVLYSIPVTDCSWAGMCVVGICIQLRIASWCCVMGILVTDCVLGWGCVLLGYVFSYGLRRGVVFHPCYGLLLGLGVSMGVIV